MMNIFLRIGLLSLVIVSLASSASIVEQVEFSSDHFKVEKLADGIYAVIHKPGGYAICNSGIIDLGDKVLVFDTFLSIEAAEDLKRAAESLTGKRVTHVINSHDHNDHIRGNQVFSPHARIISTQSIRENIAKNEPEQIAYEKEHAPARLTEMQNAYKKEKDEKKRRDIDMWVGYYEGMIRTHDDLVTTLPDLTFRDELTIYGTKGTARLITFNTAHTDNDLVLFLPEARILFSGDLVFNGMHPYLPHGNPDHLVAALEELLKLKSNHIIPGHGEVGGPEIITNMINYVNSMRNLAMDAKRNNKPVEEIVISDLPEPFALWKFPRFFKANITFMYNPKKQ